MMRLSTFSEDRKRRFELIREWSGLLDGSEPRIVNFIMLNPSVADDVRDDPTVRKCIGFAKRWDFGCLVVTNLIPIVSTDPWALPAWSGFDAENIAYIHRWICHADLVVAAWGSQPRALSRRIALSEHVMKLHESASVPLYCIGRTARGDPSHPSRSKYTQSPNVWRIGHKT